jgi:hypothetical protein
VAPRAPDRLAWFTIELNENLAPVVRLRLERQLEHDALASKHVVVNVVTQLEDAPNLHLVLRLHEINLDRPWRGRKGQWHRAVREADALLLAVL